MILLINSESLKPLKGISFMDTFYTATFTTSKIFRIGNYASDVYEVENFPIKRKKPRGFCLNTSCKSKGELYKIKNKNYRKNYSTDNLRVNDCPHCLHALFWTAKWDHIEGFKDKEFIYKERPVLCP